MQETRQPKKQLSDAPYQLIYPTSKRVDETWLRTAYADMVTTRWHNEDSAHWDDADTKRYWTEAKSKGTIEDVIAALESAGKISIWRYPSLIR